MIVVNDGLGGMLIFTFCLMQSLLMASLDRGRDQSIRPETIYLGVKRS